MPDSATWGPRILSILRIVTGLLYLVHGLVKLFGFPPGAAPGKVPLGTLFGVAGIIELAGGVLIVLGLFTRPVAFLLSGQMAVAYFMVHAPQSFYPVLNGRRARHPLLLRLPLSRRGRRRRMEPGRPP